LDTLLRSYDNVWRPPSGQPRVQKIYEATAEGKSYVLPPVNVPRWRARFQKYADAAAAIRRASSRADLLIPHL